MPQYVKVGGTWRPVDESITCGSVKVGGVWRDVRNAYVKVNGNWRSVCSTNPEVVLSITSTDVDSTYNIRLDWTNINVIQTGAEIYRNGSFIGSVGAATTQFNDNSLTCGTTWSYYVRINGSLNSNTVSRTTPSCPQTTVPPSTQPPTTEPPGETFFYRGSACCNGSPSYYASSVSCAEVQNYFNNNCSSVSNFTCSYSQSFTPVSCGGVGPGTTTSGPGTTTSGPGTTTSSPGCIQGPCCAGYNCVEGALVDNCGNVVNNCAITCGCDNEQTTSAAPTTSSGPGTTSSTAAPCTNCGATTTSSTTTSCVGPSLVEQSCINWIDSCGNVCAQFCSEQTLSFCSPSCGCGTTSSSQAPATTCVPFAGQPCPCPCDPGNYGCGGNCVCPPCATNPPTTSSAPTNPPTTSSAPTGPTGPTPTNPPATTAPPCDFCCQIGCFTGAGGQCFC